MHNVLLKRRVVRPPLLTYTAIPYYETFCEIFLPISTLPSHSQLIPLLLVTKHEDGGYSLDDNELGILFMVSAVLQLVYHVRTYV